MNKHCDFCDKDFEKGHLCWCRECNKPHPMCNKCYVDASDKGLVITDKQSYGGKDEDYI